MQTTHQPVVNQPQPQKWSLQLPTAAATKSSSNRISPLMTKRNTSPSLVVKYNNDSPTTTTMTHLFKRLARTPSSLSMRNSSWLQHQLSSLGNKKKDSSSAINIHMKSPHVVASGELAGTLVIHLEKEQEVEGIELSFVGVEAVVPDSQHSNTSTTQHEFLNLEVLNLAAAEQVQSHHLVQENMLAVPFFITLPSQLSGTYVDKKGSTQYHLSSEVKYASSEEKKGHEQPVTLYPNVVAAASFNLGLYSPVSETKQAYGGNYTISLSKNVWMSGAPIYLKVNLLQSREETTAAMQVCDMKLELLRKQNTNCLNNEDNSIIPLTSTCEVIASCVNSSMGYTKNHYFIMSIDAPVNQATVLQKLIDVAYFIRVIVCSTNESTTEETIAEMPIMLVHPVAMNPPPSLLSTITEEKEEEEVVEIIPLFGEKLSESSSPPTIASNIPRISISSSSASMSSRTKYESSPLIRITQSTSSTTAPILAATTPTNTTNKPLEKMKRTFSTWGTRLSRKISMSRIPTTATKARPEISSPILSSYSSSSEEADNESIISSLYASPKQDLNSMIQRKGEQRRSIMKFGQMKGPKRFGQQPGSLGDAGLDIRNCFNVAKVTEVIRSFAAEKVEIPDDIAFNDGGSSDSEKEDDEAETPTRKENYPPYLEPVQLTEDFIWKEGFIAPPEKCQLDKSMLEQEEPTKKRYRPEGNKRMLASSRHLMHIQQRRKSSSAQALKQKQLSFLPPSSV